MLSKIRQPTPYTLRYTGEQRPTNGERSAQFERSLAITDDGVEMLTAL